MSSTEQVAGMADGVRTAVDASAGLWRRRVEEVTAEAGAWAKLPAPSLDQATEQYFEYLQRSLQINRELSKKWADALSSFSDATGSQASSLGAAVRGHTEAIRDWLVAEIDTVQQAAAAQAQAVQETKRSTVRQQYSDLSRAELAALLGERDLPRTGTVEELLGRLVDADTR
jgi:hypothetical protein